MSRDREVESVKVAGKFYQPEGERANVKVWLLSCVPNGSNDQGQHPVK